MNLYKKVQYKIINKKKNKMINNKSDILNAVLEYFIDCFYLEPNKKINIDELHNKFGIENIEIIDLFINDLKKKKKILGKKEFIITFDGFIYLDNLLRSRYEYRNNKIAIILSIGTFSFEILAIINDEFSKFFMFFLVSYIMYVTNKLVSSKKIYK